jgi:hypothetical protein
MPVPGNELTQDGLVLRLHPTLTLLDLVQQQIIPMAILERMQKSSREQASGELDLLHTLEEDRNALFAAFDAACCAAIVEPPVQSLEADRTLIAHIQAALGSNAPVDQVRGWLDAAACGEEVPALNAAPAALVKTWCQSLRVGEINLENRVAVWNILYERAFGTQQVACA